MIIYEVNMKKKKNEWELEESSVWITEDGVIKPSPFFLRWWREVSTINYGDDSHWLDVAVELGYVLKEIDPITKSIIYEPEGFDYDPQLLRVSLGIPPSMPIVAHENNDEGYQRLVKWVKNE